MKKILFLVILVFSSNVLSKAGPKVPIPKLSYTEAYNIANELLLSKKYNVDTEYFFVKDYILNSINYQKSEDVWVWVWVVSFFHPVANDHSVTFHIAQNGKLIKHAATE